MNAKNIYLITVILSFILTTISTQAVIVAMRKIKVGQSILVDGPNWHIKKEGTPTMGGIAFLLSFVVSYGVVAVVSYVTKNYDFIKFSAPLFVYAIFNAGIGMVDDLSKVRKKENKGLSAKSKFALQALAAIIFLIILKFTVGINTNIEVPFFNFSINLGIFYYIFAFLTLCGFVNAVNLTDGIDGLASSVGLSVACIFSFVALFLFNDSVIAYFSSILVGILVSFLIFNKHPAKIFMGDTGSLFLGSIIVGFSFLIGNPLLVFIYGFMFLIEAASVILQVLVFKLFKGRRLFKMAPLHHHLEKNGWSENKIVVAFSLINFVACIIMLLVLI